MNCIIAGSRTITDYNLVQSVIESAPFRAQITTVLCGMAAGVDILGYRWAYANRIPIREFKPDWNTYGKMGGIIRNGEMACCADAAIVIWDGSSRGTAHLIKYMKGLDPKVVTHLFTIPRTRPDGSLLNGSSPVSSPDGQSLPPVYTSPLSVPTSGPLAPPQAAISGSAHPSRSASY